MVPVARIAIAATFALLPGYAMADSCTAAVHRLLGFLKEEAVGTRHEAQIKESIEQNGEGTLVSELASEMTEDQCAMILIAPDSTVRALAISMLPERSEK